MTEETTEETTEEKKVTAEEMKAENDLLEVEIKRRENLESRRRMGGSTDAGEPRVSKEETPQEYRDRLLGRK